MISLNIFGIDSAGSRAVAAGASCSVSVDVIATGSNAQDNVSGDLSTTVQGQTRPSGGANATLDVSTSTLHIVKEFTDDPVNAGAAGTLEFRIQNFDRSSDATDVAFTDSLPAGLVLATPADASSSCAGRSAPPTAIRRLD